MVKRNSRTYAWVFTIFNHDDNYISNLTDVLENKYQCHYIMQEETCPTTQKVHLQGYIRFKNAKTLSLLQKIFAPLHPCFAPSRLRHQEAAEAYCKKQETRTGGLWSNWYIPVKNRMRGKTPYRWQQEILDLIKTEPDDTTVHWYWSSLGSNGKSTLATYICQIRKDAIIIGGKKNDIYYGIASTKLKPTVVMIDIARAQVTKEGFPAVSYIAIECVKNGCFYSAKYESAMCIFNPPHVIVFSNYEPQQDQLTDKKWCIREINTDDR